MPPSIWTAVRVETPRLAIDSFWFSSSRAHVISIVVPATVSREVI
jgi:hypothetical protein